jgi:hypothetical protein
MAVSVSSRVAGRAAEAPGHEHVVDVAAVDEELLPQGPLPAEAEALIPELGHDLTVTGFVGADLMVCNS